MSIVKAYRELFLAVCVAASFIQVNFARSTFEEMGFLFGIALLVVSAWVLAEWVYAALTGTMIGRRSRRGAGSLT